MTKTMTAAGDARGGSMINPAAANHLQACDFRCAGPITLYTQDRLFGLPSVTRFIVRAIPEESGVYVILTEEEVLYVGSSGIGKANLSKRLRRHLTSERRPEIREGILALLTAGHSVEVWVCTGEGQIVTARSGREINGFLAIEHDLIDHFHPRLNVIGTTRSHPAFSEGASKAHKTRQARKAARLRPGAAT
jgi:excinuclease UvrABC nuclease subunit